MQAVGVIVEYNPFHNGHLYHLTEAKRVANADIVIAVMSGHFLQRGEPALVDKWQRTKMALANGADIVIELPYVYSTAQAKDFAKGGVALLEAIGCHTLVFGSEDGQVTPFLNTYNVIHTHRAIYEQIIKETMQTGSSYPKALHTAFQYLTEQFPNEYVDLSLPNNILGYHYVEAIQTLNATIQPLTIPRIGAGYHELIGAETHIASATGIRKALADGQTIEQLNAFTPHATTELLVDWQNRYEHFANWDAFWPLLKFAIIRQTPAQLTQYAEVTEGIEHTLYKAAKTSDSFEVFMHKIKSKRYTWTRLQRMLTHIYTGFTKQQFQSFSLPTTLRLLGMTKAGQRYIGLRKKEISLPIVSRVAGTDDAMLAFDCHATDMYRLGMELHTKQPIPHDYQTPPIRFN